MSVPIKRWELYIMTIVYLQLKVFCPMWRVMHFTSMLDLCSALGSGVEIHVRAYTSDSGAVQLVGS